MPVLAPVGAAIGSAMASLSAAAPAIGAITGVASTGLAIKQGSDARKAAGNAAQDAATQNSKLAESLYNQKATAESEANAIAARDAQRNRAKALALGASGRRNTILTSPLGDMGAPAGERKTLLGS